MGLRFFADHCVSTTIIQSLRQRDHDDILLRQHLPIDAPDSRVIAKAQELDAILVSLNGDFADIVAYPPAQYKGIIALQLRNHPELTPQLMATPLAYLARYPDMGHYRGKLLLVEAHRIRMRV